METANGGMWVEMGQNAPAPGAGVENAVQPENEHFDKCQKCNHANEQIIGYTSPTVPTDIL